MQRDPDRLAFAGMGRPIVVSGCAALVTGLHALTPRWPVLPAAEQADADISVAREGGRFHLRALSWPGGSWRMDDAQSAANALVGLLIDALLARDANLLCLHAMALERSGRALLCLGASGAGKSTLALGAVMAGCATAGGGWRVMGDDRILVEPPFGQARTPCHARALGLAVKLRLPAPDKGLATFAMRRAALASPDRCHVALRGDEAAPFGARAPIAGLVFLERGSAGGAALLPLGRAAAVARLVPLATRPGASAPALIGCLTALAGGVPRHTLTYARHGDAVERLSALLAARAAA